MLGINFLTGWGRFLFALQPIEGGFVSKEILLFRLRSRLAFINRLLEDVAHVAPASSRYMYAAGQTVELRSEATWLVELIEDLEKDPDGQQ